MHTDLNTSRALVASSQYTVRSARTGQTDQLARLYANTVPEDLAAWIAPDPTQRRAVLVDLAHLYMRLACSTESGGVRVAYDAHDQVFGAAVWVPSTQLPKESDLAVAAGDAPGIFARLRVLHLELRLGAPRSSHQLLAALAITGRGPQAAAVAEALLRDHGPRLDIARQWGHVPTVSAQYRDALKAHCYDRHAREDSELTGITIQHWRRAPTRRRPRS